MKNLTFTEYTIVNGILDGCIILAEYVYNPKNENTDFYEFSYSLLNEIFKDYNKTYNATETLVDAICEVEYIRRMIDKQVKERGEREREKNETSTSLS